jgi:GST-like protein
LIDLYYWTTPNGHKITMFLEETGTPYRILPINIGRGEQFAPEFLRISPNNRIPAIVDTEPGPGESPLAIFESGAILEYLAEKTGALLPRSKHERFDVLQWLYWQVANLGPMAGQNHHFTQYAPAKVPYAIERYVKETSRLYAVLDRRLEGREFITGEFSIADIASYPWIVSHERQQQKLEDYPNLARWFNAIRARPATQRAYARAAEINPPSKPVMADQARRILVGQDASTVRTRA